MTAQDILEEAMSMNYAEANEVAATLVRMAEKLVEMEGQIENLERLKQDRPYSPKERE